MIRVYRNADTKYIEKLLTEIEENKDVTYDIEILEYRVNGEIETITINTKQVLDCGF